MLQIPGYRIVEELASGASGTVYRAVQLGLSREVAVKVLSPGLFDERETRDRFLREAKIQAGLSHPNLLALFDAGFAGGRPFMVCELVRGGSLRDLLDRAGTLAVEEAARIGAAAAAGMAHAHRAAIVHRDLKPENILLTGQDAASPADVKVADFGLAKTAIGSGDAHTAAGVLLGTPGYMAPEAIRGEAAGPAADVYALGVILFEMLAGRRPFTSGDSGAVLAKQLAGDHESLEGARPDVPSEVAGLVRRCLDPEPGRRPAAEEVARVLEGLSSGEARGPALRTRASRGSPAVPSARSSASAGATRITRTPGTTGAPVAGRRRWAVAAAALVTLCVMAWLRPARHGEPAGPYRTATQPREPAPAPPPRVASVTTSQDRARVWLDGPASKGLVLSIGPIEEQTAAGLRIAVGEGALSAAVTGLLPERGYRGVLRTAATTSEFTFRTCRPIDKRRSAGCFLQTGETGSGSVIAAAGSRLVAGWRHETDGSKKLRFAESLDGGLTWSPPHPLAPDGPPDCPVALGSDGTTFAAAIGVVQGGPAQMWVRFSSAARTGWSTPVTLESGLHDPALASAGGGRFDLLAWGAWLPGVEPSVRWHGISTSGGALSTGRRAFVLSHRHSGVTCAYLTHSGRRLCVFAIDEDRSGRRWANWTSTDDPENGEWAPWRPLIEPGEGLSSDLGVACGDGILCVGYALGGVVKVCVSQDDGRTFRTLAGPVHEKLLDWEPAVAIWKKQVFLGAHCLSPADPNGPTILVFYRSADLVSWESVGRLALPLIEPKDMRFAVSEDRIVAVVADHHAGLASFTLPIKPASSSQ